MKENGFKLTKEKKQKVLRTNNYGRGLRRWHSASGKNTRQAKTLLHSLEWEAAGIGRHVNAHKTEYMRFDKRGDIFTLNDISLKLVDKLTYLGSNESSTETDINTRRAKAWTANDSRSVIWKTDLTDKMKRSFFQSSGRVDTAVWRHYMDANWTYGEKAWRL